MKTIKKYFPLLLSFICMALMAGGQETETQKRSAAFKLSLNYNSHLNYYGRTDSLRSSGLFPMGEIWIKERFYINAAPVFANNSSTGFEYAGTVAAIGVQIGSGTDWAGNVYLIKPFYKEESGLVQSALKAQTGFLLSKLSSFVNVTAGADMKFSNKTDVGLTGGLDHTFRIQLDEKSAMIIDPSAYVYAGTQQFTNTYYKQNNFLFFPGLEQEVTESVKKFNVLSYEFTLPVIFATEKFQVSLTPAYVLPQNLIKVEGRPDLSERGQNLFYFTTGIKMIL